MVETGGLVGFGFVAVVVFEVGIGNIPALSFGNLYGGASALLLVRRPLAARCSNGFIVPVFCVTDNVVISLPLSLSCITGVTPDSSVVHPDFNGHHHVVAV